MRIPAIAIVLLAVIAAALFMAPVHHGKPVLDWRQVRDHWRQPQRWLTSPIAGLGGGGESHAYRWRDAHGNWQYGQIPPPGVDAESVIIKAPTVITPEEMRGEGKPAQEKQP